MESKSNLSYLSATGKIEYNMTNNYMFRYILQQNEKVLICREMLREKSLSWILRSC